MEGLYPLLKFRLPRSFRWDWPWWQKELKRRAEEYDDVAIYANHAELPITGSDPEVCDGWCCSRDDGRLPYGIVLGIGLYGPEATPEECGGDDSSIASADDSVDGSDGGSGEDVDDVDAPVGGDAAVEDNISVESDDAVEDDVSVESEGSGGEEEVVDVACAREPDLDNDGIELDHVEECKAEDLGATFGCPVVVKSED